MISKPHTCHSSPSRGPFAQGLQGICGFAIPESHPLSCKINPNTSKTSQNHSGWKKPQRWPSPTSTTMFTTTFPSPAEPPELHKGKFQQQKLLRPFQTWIFPCMRDLLLTIYPPHPSLFPCNALLTLWGFLFPCSPSPFSTATSFNTMKSGNKI